MGRSGTMRWLWLAIVFGSQLDAGTCSKSKLKVAICPDNPPYAIQDSDTGAFRGFDVAVWGSVYRNLVPLTVNNTVLRDLVGSEPPDLISQDVAEILANLKSGEIDIGICNLFVTSERILEGIDFTPAYVASSFAAVVTSGHEAWLPIWRVLRRFSFTSFPPWAHFSAALIIIAAFAFGHIIWLLERQKNPQFAVSYGKGIMDGFWYAIVSATTVGYGDKVTITLAGKFASVVWLLLGTFLAALFYAAVTVNLLDTDAMEPYRGFNVDDIPEDLHPHRVATAIPQLKQMIERQGVPVTLYADRAGLFAGLVANEFEVALEQAETVQFLNAEDHVLRGRLIVTGPPFTTIDAAFAVGRQSGARAGFLEPLSKAVMVYLTQWEERQAHLSDWFGLGEESGRAEERRVFEGQLSRLNVLGIAVFATLILGWGFVLFLERRAKHRTRQSITCFRRLLQLSTKFSRERLRVGAENLFLRLDQDRKGWVGLEDVQRVVGQSSSLSAGRLLGPSVGALHDDLRALILRTARMINALGEDDEEQALKLYPQSFGLLCRTILLHEDEQAVAGASLSLHASKKDLICSTDSLVAALQATHEHMQDMFAHVDEAQRTQQRLDALARCASRCASPAPSSSSHPSSARRRRSSGDVTSQSPRKSKSKTPHGNRPQFPRNSSRNGSLGGAAGSVTRDLPSPLQRLQQQRGGDIAFSSRSSAAGSVAVRRAASGSWVGEDLTDANSYWV